MRNTRSARHYLCAQFSSCLDINNILCFGYFFHIVLLSYRHTRIWFSFLSTLFFLRCIPWMPAYCLLYDVHLMACIPIAACAEEYKASIPANGKDRQLNEQNNMWERHEINIFRLHVIMIYVLCLCHNVRREKCRANNVGKNFAGKKERIRCFPA